MFPVDLVKWVRFNIHYQSFRKKSMNVSKSIVDLKHPIPDGYYDYLIVGSDQIWNPELTGAKLDPFYTLNFDFLKTRKISYAASFSPNHISSDQLQSLKNCLKTFSAVSVREDCLMKTLESDNPVAIETVLDPTLLLNRNDWLKYMPPKRLVDKKYVLLYQARGAKEPLLTKTKRIAEELNASVIDVSGMNYRVLRCGMQYVNPIEFVNLIFYAEFVVTASFHGTALSIVLQKPFCSFLLNDGRDDRVLNLLDSFGLQACGKRIDEDVVANDFLNKRTLVDFESHRKISKTFICRSLGIV